MSVRTTTSLAPATVAAVAAGDTPSYRPLRPQRGRWVDRVTSRQIDDRLLASSLAAAGGGDANRLWFGPDGAVWILNHRRGETCFSPACPACEPIKIRPR